jgi:hypothetical protein
MIEEVNERKYCKFTLAGWAILMICTGVYLA